MRIKGQVTIGYQAIDFERWNRIMIRHEAWPNTHFVLESLDLRTIRAYPDHLFVNRFLFFKKKTAIGRNNNKTLYSIKLSIRLPLAR
jgi:hypothetical protein